RSSAKAARFFRRSARNGKRNEARNGMTDEALIDAFESGTLEDFPHELHVRMAWCYLRRDPILVALPRFKAALRRFAAGKGKADRYHETITVAFMLLIAERLGPAR